MRHLFCISLSVFIFSITAAFGQGDVRGKTVVFSSVSLRAAIDSLMRRYPISVIYLDRDVEGIRVSLSCDSCTGEQALDKMLQETSLTWIRSGDQYILLHRPPAQSPEMFSLSGTVRDSLTEESLPGATALLYPVESYDNVHPFRGCTSNDFGFFVLQHVPEGIYELTLRSLGYATLRRRIVVGHTDLTGTDYHLVPSEIAMEEVTVEGYRSGPAGDQSVAHGLYLRSTPADYNSYLLDGARVYNPAHYGGVTTTVDEEMLNDVTASSGGVPAVYGGQMGGIVDLSLRTGSFRQLTGTASLGSLGGSLSVEGPLSPRVSFLLTGRRGFPEPVVPTLEATAERNRLGTTEASAKLLYRISGSSRISANAFASRDSYASEAEGAGKRLASVLDWENRLLNVRFLSVVGPSVFLRSGVSYTWYGMRMSNGFSFPPQLSSNASLSSDFSIEDFRLRAQAESYLDEYHTLRMGLETIHHRLDGFISPFSTQTATYDIHGYTAWESAFSLQDEWRLLPGVFAQLGGRVSSYTGDGGSFSAVDPRISLLVDIGPAARLFGSLTTINEFLHPYRASGAFLLTPGIFWYASTDRIRPMTSQQATIGGEYDLDDGQTQVSADGFYRVIRNMHQFIVDSSSQADVNLSDIVKEGTGVTYGVMATLQRRAGRFAGTLTYTLSWVKNSLSDALAGQPLYSPFDRRHEIQASLAYVPDDHWTFGLLCVIASLQAPQLTRSSALRAAGSDVGFGPASSLLPDLNSDRLPGFQRLEIQGGYRTAMGGIPVMMTLRLLNSYGLLDPFKWALTGTPDIRTQWTARLNDVPLFPLYPTIEISVRF